MSPLKQVVQSYRTGELRLAEVPPPAPSPATLLVQTCNSLISIGTERSMIDIARRSLLGKARARPDLVRQVLNKARTEGLGEAYRQAAGRLDTPVPLGYSAAGIVTFAGTSASGFAVGDRVACAGSGVASHAEILRVPRTLAVRIPDSVGMEAAAFVALGGIAIHAVRLAQINFGERAVVVGLGLLGQLAVQILAAVGCRAFGVDVVAARVAMALEHGAHSGATMAQEDVAAAVRRFTDGHGADAVLVFASTDSNEPVELAAEVARDRGRLVVPGLVGLDIPRKPFYEKELELVVSRAWGPGMYDADYEEGAVDYPLPFVRWTAQRNMAHFLEMLSGGQVAVDFLITHRFPLVDAVRAYDHILAGEEPTLGVILQYPDQPPPARAIWPRAVDVPTAAIPASVRPEHDITKDLRPRDPVRVGLIGAGQFARGTLLPALKGVEGVVLRAVATSTGVSAEDIARKHGLAYCTTDTEALLDDAEIDVVMILTRHGTHASLVSQALAAGKHVFVEKPLALNDEQLEQVVRAYRQSSGQLMVGLNRRFAPTVAFLLERLRYVSPPLAVTVRANVGHIPPDVWVHDPEQGGGNLVGEVCHFVDLILALTGSVPVRVYAQTVHAGTDVDAVIAEDNVALSLEMADGSLGTVVYCALGDKAYEREQVEVFGGGAAGVIHNFRTANWSQAGKGARMGGVLSGVDRGHRAEMKALIGALRRGQPFPVSLDNYVATTRTTFAAMQSLRSGLPVEVALPLPPPGARRSAVQGLDAQAGGEHAGR